MMGELIPRLSDLLFVHSGFVVPAGFVESYVKLHEQDWDKAQDHWERFVRLVLDTDQVPQKAKGEEAMGIAVAAASEVLHQPPLRSHCRRCAGDRRRT